MEGNIDCSRCKRNKADFKAPAIVYGEATIMPSPPLGKEWVGEAPRTHHFYKTFALVSVGICLECITKIIKRNKVGFIISLIFVILFILNLIINIVIQFLSSETSVGIIIIILCLNAVFIGLSVGFMLLNKERIIKLKGVLTAEQMLNTDEIIELASFGFIFKYVGGSKPLPDDVVIAYSGQTEQNVNILTFDEIKITLVIGNYQWEDKYNIKLYSLENMENFLLKRSGKLLSTYHVHTGHQEAMLEAQKFCELIRSMNNV